MQRVRGHVNSTLTESRCVQICIASSMRDPGPIVGFLLSHTMRRIVDEHAEEICLKEDEWAILFSSSVSPVMDGGMLEFSKSQVFLNETAALENALKLTILEHDQQQMWAKPWHRLVAYIAIHMDYGENAILSSLGTIIKADKRKLEDLMNDIDDDEVETLVFVRAIELVSAVLLGTTL